MKKVTVAIGTVILVLGILLTAFTFIAIPENKTESYQVPKSTVIVDQFGFSGPSVVVDPTANWADGFTFSAGETLNIQVNVTSGQKIAFSVTDGSRSLNSNVDASTAYLFYPNVNMVNTDWVVPRNSSYNFVFSSSSTVSANDVHWQITKQWTETDYRSVTQNVRLLPFQVFYVGVIIALSGLAITVYGYEVSSFRMNRTPSKRSWI